MSFRPRELYLWKRAAINDRRWGCALDGSLGRPSTFSRIGHSPRKPLQVRIFYERASREIEKPRADNTSSPPHFGHIRQGEVVLKMLRMPNWSGLGIHRRCAFTGICMREDVESLRVHSHESVFDAVVNHFGEVTRASWTTVEVTLCRGVVTGTSSRSARR